MRTLRNFLLLLVLGIGALVIWLSWLARSEQGSRWLIDTALRQLPVQVELQDVRGTLLAGLTAGRLQITLPVATISARDVRVSWQPASLLAGRVTLDTVQIGELHVDVQAAETATSEGPDPDALFWLQLPVDVRIDTGRIDTLRVGQTELTQLEVRGAIGWGRLQLEYAAAELAGAGMRLRGRLAGDYPGRLTAEGDWRWPEGGLAGAGRFSGDLDELKIQQVVRIPEPVTVAGVITDLLAGPVLTGTAQWARVRLPGEAALYSEAGNFLVRSDFLSALVSGKTLLRQENGSDLPLALTAAADFERIDVRSFRLGVFNGMVTGRGQLDYREGLRGAFDIRANALDIAALRDDVAGRLDFAAQVKLDGVEDIVITAPQVTALLAAQTITGQASAELSDGELAALTAVVKSGPNRLDADLQLLPALGGTVKIAAPDLKGLLPELAGALDGQATLGGTLAAPRIRLLASGRALEWADLRAARVDLDFDSSGRERLVARLTADDLQRDTQVLGNLQLELNGTRRDHRLSAELTKGVADVIVSAAGSWDGAMLTQRLLSASIRQPELGTWRLDGMPRLRIATDEASLEAHCWRQKSARICIGDSRRTGVVTETSLELDRFPLATLAPLLPQDLTVEGFADARLAVRAEGTSVRGSLRWQQRDTALTWLLEGESLTTRLQSVDVDLVSAATGATLTAALRGEQGLMFDIAAELAAPASPDSVLKGRVTGRLPDITVLRPYLFRFVDAGDMAGQLSLDLELQGTPRNPLFSGGFNLEDGVLQLPDAGITLADISLSATSAGNEALALNGRFRSGDGAGTLGGELGIGPGGSVEGTIRVAGENLRTVQLPQLSLYSSPDLTLRIAADGIDIRGRVAIPKALAQLRNVPATVAAKSPDVVVHDPARNASPPGEEKQVSGDVELVLGDNVRFRGFGLDSRLDGTLRLRQKNGGVLRGTGTVRVRDGFLMGYGKELRVDRGTLNFTGPLDDPGVNVQVSRTTIYEGRQYTVGLRLTGTARNVITTPFSSPAMSERDVLAFLLLDRPASTSGEDTDLSGAVLALGLGQMLPGGDSDSVISRIGLDEVSFEGSELEQTSVVAGKRITDDLYVRYVFGLFGEAGSLRVRYRLGRGFSLESSTGNSQALDLIYVVEK